MSGMGAERISGALRAPLTALWAVWLANGEAVHANEVVSFPSLDGALTGGVPTALRGLLLRPAGAGSFPAVVALHGCTGLFDSSSTIIPITTSIGPATNYTASHRNPAGPSTMARMMMLERTL
jgi:hypothetical protein